MSKFTDLELEAYLDEALSPSDMSGIEEASRKDDSLLRRLAEINRRRDMGVHSLGEVWRRQRLSCPKRKDLGAYLLDALDSEKSNYIYFHITEIGCRYCQANIDDLQAEKNLDKPAVESRRSKYYQSSVGYLDKSE